MKTLRFLVTPIFSVFAYVAAEAGSGITYHGRLMQPGGTSAVTSTHVEFKIQIRTPGAENCLLYEETHVKDLSDSNGMFALGINDGSAASPNIEPFGLNRVFQNRGTFTFAGGKCGTGSTYTPNPTDGRKLVVEFADPSAFVGWEPLPAQSINFVPMAIETMTVGGFGAESVLRVVDGAGNPAPGISALSIANHNTLMSLLAGTAPLAGANLVDGSVTDVELASGISGAKISGNISGNAAGFTGNLAGDVTGAQGATTVARIQGRVVDTATPLDGQVLKWNNSNSRWEPANDANGGTIASVTGTSPIQVTVGANPVVSILDATASQKGAVLLALDGAATAGRAVEATDSRLSDARTPTAHTHNFNQLTNIAGNFLRYHPNNVACSDGQVLKWNLTLDRWECGNDSTSGGGSGITSLGLQTGSTQTFAAGAAGNSPAIVSAADIHTLNVPLASASGSVTSGTISNADYVAFSGKVAPARTITAGTGLTGGGNLSADRTLAVNVGTGANQIPQLDAGGKLLAAVLPAGVVTSNTLAGDVTGNFGASVVERIRGNPVAAGVPSDGQVLVANSGTWTALNFGVDDLRSQATGAAQFASASCLNNQTLTWVSLSDTFACANIVIDSSNITDGSIVSADLSSALSDSMWAASGGNVFRASGSVGIGTTVPEGILHTSGSTDIYFDRFINDGSPMTFTGRKARGTQAVPLGVASGDRLLSIGARGAIDTGAFPTGGISPVIMNFVATEAHTATAAGTAVSFAVTKNGTLTRTESLRISDDGNVGIGTAVPHSKLTVQGDVTLDQLALDPAGTVGYGSLYVKTDGKLYYRNGTGATTDLTAAGGSGEVNTASNVGVGGVGVFKQKTVANLEFKNINAASTKISITNDAGNNEVDIDVNEANLSLGSLSGTLPLNKGGTNASLTAANGGVVYSTATAMDVTAAGSAGQMLRSAGAAAPVWSTATYPATTTINQLLFSSAANTIAGLATANSSVLTTNGSGVPSWGAISSDTFTQYALLAGRSGGQTVKGGTGSGDDLILESTNHATKGDVILNPTGGNVAIGTTTASAKLHVVGQVVSGSHNNLASTTFDFNNGNVQYTSANCGSYTLSNMVDGGSYTIVVNGTTAGTCVFTHSGLTFLWNYEGPTTGSTKSIFNLQRVGTQVFVDWSTGYE